MSRDAGKRAARGAVWLFLSPCSFLFLVGCQSGGSCFMEAELRCREAELRQLRAERDRLAACNQALQQHIMCPPSNSAKFTPPSAPQMAPLADVVLGRQTGGRSEDNKTGDEILQVIIEPRDPGGRPLRAPGSAFVAVLQTGADEQEIPVCSWDIPAEALARTWRFTLVSTGYHLILPWKSYPDSDRLRVLVQFTMPDGRIFEADREITIQPVPPAQRKDLPVSKPAAAEPGGTQARSQPRVFMASKPADVEPAAHQIEDHSQTYLSDAIQLERPEPLINPFLGR